MNDQLVLKYNENTVKLWEKSLKWIEPQQNASRHITNDSKTCKSIKNLYIFSTVNNEYELFFIIKDAIY